MSNKKWRKWDEQEHCAICDGVLDLNSLFCSATCMDLHAREDRKASYDIDPEDLYV